ncbi:plastocyanin/azurin family copper-binding protein [Halococcus dombrowskii]|uniref:Plastocyanin/azurin family copper-binding protein n=1 Tax=Halococcus dombrowskii TaxID=179637 RepID=A0AAV3SK30_HALDO|nr:plastocyanin/azurin family copper-binding protein [Halococcus dombrowskii]UOO96227.1 plastocyanin/azurin family copper-binding protein [Halococcus dombrowskii]
MQRTNRRRFLAGIATTGTVLAAGCSSSGSAGDGGDGSNGTASGGSGDETATGGNATSESGGSTSGTSGNSSASGGETTTVASGPDGRLVFDPEAVEVSVGDTVAWEFESAGHNVSGVPEDNEEVSIPDGAEPFSSYDGDPYAVVEEGKTYEHTFETAGEYTYVCIPHVSSGMVGTVTVSE